ncbi:MAG TPA: nuclear transport factor 2 family protein [Luteimonas sp.]|nr:nuclear transport factor 2 family protein [Luteimonas sp.]
MKLPSITVWLLAFLVAIPTLAAAHDPKDHATAASTQQVSEQAKPVVAVVEQFSSALKAGDLKRAAEALADDVLILESGGAERSREEYLGHHAIADAAFLGGAKIALQQRTARIDGNMAWVASESELQATEDGKPMTLLSTETMILHKTADGWRIVHIHWSSRPKKGT